VSDEGLTMTIQGILVLRTAKNGLIGTVRLAHGPIAVLRTPGACARNPVAARTRNRARDDPAAVACASRHVAGM